MVIVKPMGGLGNQLFQYAAARRLAHINHLPVKIDISNYIIRSDGTQVDARPYELDRFNLDGAIVSDEDLAQLQETKLELLWKKTRHKLHLPIHYYQKPYIYEPEENQYRLDVNFLRLRVRRTVCLIGFWENEGYFKDIRDRIRREYTLKTPLDDRNAELLMEIMQNNSVSLHIRRGDKTAQSPWGVLPIEYYVSAADYVAARSPRPHFYVFSDDVEWVRANFRSPYPVTIVAHNVSGAEDLRLMVACQHHIIANSTFSWWGAWLGQNPERLVIAPRRYFQNTNRPVPDFYPPSWVLI
jgi:hypothetical protein